MWSFFILAFLSWVSSSNSAKCPSEYERFSLKHTFCISKNPRCDIKRSGVSQQDIQEILRLHNQYRSDVANGKETRAKGRTLLPKAAGMLQMVWDDELAGIAQKWAENCEFGHDCYKCRTVPNFGVGQNLVIQRASCSRCKEDDITAPKWAEAMKGLYDEVSDFHKRWLDRYQSHDGPDVGHFTQMVWSKTWRLGCGYTAHKIGKKYERFYVCNYGPAGNVLDEPIYKQGHPCSDCPNNTCCGSSCGSALNYPGLCKMLNPNTAPLYPRNLSNLLFFCDFNPKTKDCEIKTNGSNKWTQKASLLGNYESIVLNGGESSTLEFKNPISPTKNKFCIRFNFGKGPLKAGEKDASDLTAQYKLDSGPVIPMILANTEHFSANLAWKTKTTLSLTFSVPRGGKPHILDLMEVMAFDGKCSSRKD